MFPWTSCEIQIWEVICKVNVDLLILWHSLVVATGMTHANSKTCTATDLSLINLLSVWTMLWNLNWANWIHFLILSKNAQTSAFSVSQSVCVPALVDSTESSGENINVLSSSDPSCLSAIGGEAVENSSSSVMSQNSKPRLPLSRMPSLRRNSSPVIIRKKPGVAPKPQHLANAQVQVNLW